MATPRRRSPLSAKTNATRNTKRGRAAMPASDFALPGKKYRIDDAAHARDALGRAAQNATPAQQATIRAAVKRKYPSIQLATPKSGRAKRTGKSRSK
jgi:hypothetical protein